MIDGSSLWRKMRKSLGSKRKEMGETDIETVTRAIVLLKERRAALISAAVTGKVDVRDLAPAEAAA